MLALVFSAHSFTIIFARPIIRQCILLPNDHPDVVRLLASHGAEPNVADKVLKTIIEFGLSLFFVSMVFYFVCVVISSLVVFLFV